MYGRVTKFLHDRGFGFIRGDDGNTYFIHHSKLNGEHIDRGYYVFFKPFQNDRSDYNAKNIIVVEARERKRKHDLYVLGAYKTCQGIIYIITNRISENAGDNSTTVLFIYDMIKFPRISIKIPQFENGNSPL